MTYPKIPCRLARTHGIPPMRARSLWDRAVKYSIALGIVTRDGTPDKESVIAIFLKFVQGEPHAHYARQGPPSFLLPQRLRQYVNAIWNKITSPFAKIRLSKGSENVS